MRRSFPASQGGHLLWEVAAVEYLVCEFKLSSLISADHVCVSCPSRTMSAKLIGEDGQLFVWDLAVERDPEEEAAVAVTSGANARPPEDLPPQLLFVHGGQQDTKEARLLQWSGP